MAGVFIAFEGGEGVGKTTQAELLFQRLTGMLLPCELAREPGGTTLGEYLRKYLKSDQLLTPDAELLLFEAARVELVINRIKPALKAGKTVIADRFAGSTIAYQGYGRRIDLEIIKLLNGFATQNIRPDLTFLLDLPPEDGLKRTVGHQLAFTEDVSGQLAPLRRNEEGRRFEDLSLAFHQKARQGFLDQAQSDSASWAVVDAGRRIEEVRAEVWGLVQDRLGLPSDAVQRQKRSLRGTQPIGEPRDSA